MLRLGLLLLLFILTAGWLVHRQRSVPRYGNRDLLEWAQQYHYWTIGSGSDRRDAPEQAAEARLAIRGIGPAAIPVFRRMLAQEYLPSSEMARMLSRLLNPNYDVGGRLAVQEAHDHAAAGLAALGPSAVPVLLQELDHHPKEVIAALATLGPEGSPAIPAIVQALESHDAEVRERAVAALAVIPGDPALVLPGVIRLLKKDPYSIRSAFGCFKHYGAAAITFLPDLRQLGQTVPYSYWRDQYGAAISVIEQADGKNSRAPVSKP